jgi:hypothetical protein
VLAIVHTLPSEATRTIALLDGLSTSTGDNPTLDFANPLTTGQIADPGFESLLSPGIGFSAGGAQRSTVGVNVAGLFVSTPRRTGTAVRNERRGTCAGGDPSYPMTALSTLPRSVTRYGFVR